MTLHWTKQGRQKDIAWISMADSIPLKFRDQAIVHFMFISAPVRKTPEEDFS